jgi:hypothetical protein
MRRRNPNTLRSLYGAALLGMSVLSVLISTPILHAEEHEDFDAYKLRVSAGWYYSTPSGYIHGANENDNIDFQKDLGFSNYSTIAARVDWKFTRKNHLYVAISPLNSSNQRVLTRTIVFEGQTFNVGVATSNSLNTLFVAPGYEYDFIRRKRGHLGLKLQMDLLNTTAKITAAAQVTNGGTTESAAQSASGSILAPIPVAGPDVRFYLTDSPRVFVDGNVLGMYLFGYGNFISAAGDIGVTLSKHFALTAGYQLASRLAVNGSTSRIGLRFTQSGALIGVQASF